MKREHLAKADFLRKLRELSQELYGLGDSSTQNPHRQLLQARVEGFIDAGILIEVASREDMQAVIDRCHFEEFGESRTERKKRIENSRRTNDEPVDWNVFDSPAYERSNNAS